MIKVNSMKLYRTVKTAAKSYLAGQWYHVGGLKEYNALKVVRILVILLPDVCEWRSVNPLLCDAAAPRRGVVDNTD